LLRLPKASRSRQPPREHRPRDACVQRELPRWWMPPPGCLSMLPNEPIGRESPLATCRIYRLFVVSLAGGDEDPLGRQQGASAVVRGKVVEDEHVTLLPPELDALLLDNLAARCPRGSRTHR
jgi:hypothetical protein